MKKWKKVHDMFPLCFIMGSTKALLFALLMHNIPTIEAH